MITRTRPLDHFTSAPPVDVEKTPGFERTLTIFDPKTDRVLGYLTVDVAREIAKWVAKLPRA